LIHQFKLPVGYTERHTTLAIEIPLLYPAAELDMFYCAPFALLQSGRVIDRTESRQVIFEVEYQRWSRHREDDKVWSPSDDSVITHLGLVEESFAREVA
jgi:hypothetical protein